MNNTMIEEFVQRYGARIDCQQGRNTVYTMGRAMDYYDNSRSKVDIELTMEAFKHLVDMDNQAEVAYQAGREEARIRARYPSVAEAYAQYKMLLELCK